MSDPYEIEPLEGDEAICEYCGEPINLNDAASFVEDEDGNAFCSKDCARDYKSELLDPEADSERTDEAD